MSIKFKIGTKININDECIGSVTRITDTHIFIKSDVFTGWATKKEITDAILSSIDFVFPHTLSQYAANAFDN